MLTAAAIILGLLALAAVVVSVSFLFWLAYAAKLQREDIEADDQWLGDQPHLPRVARALEVIPSPGHWPDVVAGGGE